MKRFLSFIALNMIFCGFLLASKQMIVRLPFKNYQELQNFIYSTFPKDKVPDIAAGRPGEWYDLIVDEYQLDLIRMKGINVNVVDENIESSKESVKDNYHSYFDVITILRGLATSYPSIAKVESIGPTYEGRWIYGLKISDNVMEDEEEPEQLFSGLHHAREWATIEVCLFLADTLIRAYGTDPQITDIVNNREIWIFPVINVDGFVYDYSNGGVSWRKDREPYRSGIGTDPNRNYNGICDSSAIDGWGYINGSSTTHNPSQETFCGRRQHSAYEINEYAEFIKSRHFVTILDYHSYSELVLAPWGHKYDATPHENWYNSIGQAIAQRIARLSGGHYTYQKSIALYPTTGSSSDWEYGWNIYVKGTPCLSFTVEMGTAFYQNPADLPLLKRENFDGAFYLLQKGDSIYNYMKGLVPSPIIIYPEVDTVEDSVRIEWQVPNSSFNEPSQFEIQILKGPSVIQDGFEGNTNQWVLESFAPSTQRFHSGTKSLYSGHANYIAAQARTRYPYPVQDSDSLRFWIYYNTETDWDVGIVEISENLREWFPLDSERFTGSSGGWVRKVYDLTSYVGKSVYFRIRYMTDGSVLNEDIYIDDFYPVAHWDTIWNITGISDTFYTITNLEEGEYFFRVKGASSAFGNGNYSLLKKVFIRNTNSPARETESHLFYASVPPVIKGNLKISIKAMNPVITILDAQGRVVYRFQKNGTIDRLVEIPLNSRGVYFYIIESSADKKIGKTVKVY